ncbi:MAG TPA: substrate-binding domain-containing protein [bacterium]|jgi:D-xylose transport system substrate-binding protein|nr:substrate-binding domain-containing protein [bacterium]
MRLMNSILICFAFLFLTGWGHWGPNVKIGLALDTAQAREPLVRKLKEAMEDNRAELILRDAKGDPTAQQSEVREMIQQGIQALVVMPCDRLKASALVSAAHQAGIKVISLESLIPDSDLDYLIAFDNEKSGELQAKALVKKVPQGSYVLLGGTPQTSQDLRKGQMKVLQPYIDRGDIQIAVSKWDIARETPSGESKELGDILAREGNRVDALVVSDDEAGSATRTLEKMNLSGKVVVGGLGEDLATCQRIASGTQWMTIYHPPQKLAEETAYLAAKLARKATEFDCQFVEVDNGSQKVKAVLLTPLAVDAGNLKSTVIDDQVQKEEDVFKK